MAKGYALTIGLNSVNPSHYDGWSGELAACEADAKDMADIAKSKRFSVKTLLTRSATRKSVIKELSKAAATLKPDDIFMLTYSGHGGQVPDKNKDEDDFQDETWCLYDGQLIDDEIYILSGQVRSGRPNSRLLRQLPQRHRHQGCILSGDHDCPLSCCQRRAGSIPIHASGGCAPHLWQKQEVL